MISDQAVRSSSVNNHIGRWKVKLGEREIQIQEIEHRSNAEQEANETSLQRQSARLEQSTAPYETTRSHERNPSYWRTVDDVLSRPASESEIANAHSRTKAEAAMTLVEQATSLQKGQARSEREMLLAIKSGKMRKSRY
jgi:hypothetical protein